MKKLTLTSIIAACMLQVQAQPGSLLSGFGTNGVVRTNFGNLVGMPLNPHFSNSLMYAPDGKYYTSSEINGMAYINRWNSNGTLDATYSYEGFSYGSRITFPSAALQADQKVVIGGFNDISYAVARYNTDGNFDMSFGTNGKVLIPMPATPFANVVYTVGIQPDGKILVAGSSLQGAFDHFTLVRLMPDGSLDAGFGTGGKVFLPIGNQASSARGFAFQPDGKIIVVGYASGSDVDVAVVRLNTNGSLDNSFNGTGVLQMDIQDDDFGSSVALQVDGKIVVGGDSKSGVKSGLLLRLNSDGTFDNSFNGNGKLLIPFGGVDGSLANVRIQPDGKIVGSGNVSTTPTNVDFGFTRVHANGTLDNSFNASGIRVINSSNNEFINNAHQNLLLLPDGKLVQLGYERLTASPNNTQIILRRVNSDGSTDNSFGANGKGSTYAAQNNTQYNDIVRQPDGKTIAVGFWNASATTTANNDMIVARYNADGSLDNSFNGSGKGVYTFGPNNETASAVLRQPDGKIIVGGVAAVTSSTNNDFALLRLNADGSLDNSFGVSGKVRLDFGTNTEVLTALLLQPDGKIIAVGTINPGATGNDFALARFNSDGSLDNSFGVNGKLTTALSAGNGSDQAMAAVLQADGKILVAGNYPNAGTKGVVVRYNANGTIDNSFNGTGIAQLNLGSPNEALGTGSIALQPDGKIVVGANTFSSVAPTVNQLALVRFNPDGTYDNSFNGTGKLLYSFIPGKQTVAATGTTHISTLVGMQWDGRIVAVSRSADIFAKNELAVARFLPNGTLDLTFNQTGYMFIDAAAGGISQKKVIIDEEHAYITGFGLNPANSGVIAGINLGTPIFCSNGQGFYANMGGNACGGTSIQGTTDILNTAIGFGFTLGRTGKSITVNPGSAASVIVVLPGGGPSKELPAGNAILSSNMGNDYLKNGRLHNSLASSVLILSLNSGINGGTLMNIPVQTGSLITQQTSGCGYEAQVVGCSSNNNSLQSYSMNSSVANYLVNNNTGTVAGLLNLANDVIGGVKTAGQNGVPSLNNIHSAIETINSAFSGCRSYVGYNNAPCPAAQQRIAGNSEENFFSEEMSVYPNPGTGLFNITLPEDASQVQLVLTDIGGRTILSKLISNNAAQLDITHLSKGVYLLQVNTGKGVLRSKLTLQ